MRSFEEHANSFVIRVWQEPRELGGAGFALRGWIEHIQSGERVYFQSLDRIAGFIVSHLKDTEQGLFTIGGMCAILWPVLSLALLAAYLVAAGGAMPGEPGAYAIRLAQLGQQPVVVALEWGQAVFPLLLWPFFLALYRFLSRRGERDLSLVAVGLGLLGMTLMVLGETFDPTLGHALGQAYADAGSQAERAAILSTLGGLLRWRRGLSQMAALLCESCVGLITLALIRSRAWRAWGWVGLKGSVLRKWTRHLWSRG